MAKLTLNVVASTEMKIEKGIPLQKYGGSTSRKYPFPDMEPGDSFAIPNGMDRKIAYAAYAYGDKYKRKYAVRKADDGNYRCWRVQ